MASCISSRYGATNRKSLAPGLAQVGEAQAIGYAAAWVTALEK